MELYEIDEKLYMIRRIHPAVSCLFFIAIALVTMCTFNPYYIVASFVSSILYMIYLKGKESRTELKLSLALIVLTTIGNPIISHNGVTVLFYLNNNRVTLEAIMRGLVIGIMISAVIFWFSIAQVLIDSERFMGVFYKFSPKLTLLISMILRYVPFLKKRFKDIHEANRTIRDRESEHFFDRVENSALEYSTLISMSLEESAQIGDSMQARGYGLAKRTSIRRYPFNSISSITLFVIVGASILSCFGIFLNDYRVYYYPQFVIHDWDLISTVCFAGFILLMILPFAIKIIGDIRWNYLMQKI